MPYLPETSSDQQLIHLHIQPKGSKTRVVGLHDGRLKIAVSSPPVDGKANKEVVRFLASVLGVHKKDVILKSGLQSRKKSVLVSSMSADTIRKIINSLL